MSTRTTKFQSKILGYLCLLAMLIISSPSAQATDVTIGSGTVSNGSTSWPAPYGNFWWSARHQFLIKASEMNSAGAYPGLIESLSFNVANTNGCDPHSGFTISLKNVSATNVTSVDDSDMTTVFGPEEVTPSTGWNTHEFDNNFCWDGVSDILVEVCFANTAYSYNASTYYSSTSFTASRYVYADGSSQCGSAMGTSSTNRPNIRFSFKEQVSNDAGICLFAGPSFPIAAGNQTVQAVLTNFGDNTLTSCTLNWSVDGTAQTATSWTGTLASGASTTVNLGTWNFQNGGSYTIAANTSNPNNTTDGCDENDGTSTTMATAMGGTFTVGGTDPDFADLAEAWEALGTGGVGSNVILNVRTGSYPGQVTLQNVPGANATRTICIQSETGDADDVVFTYAGTSTTDMGTIRVASSFISFKNVTIENTGVSYGNAVEFTGPTSNVSFEDCILIRPTSTSSTNYRAVVFSRYIGHSDITFDGCEFRNGSYGIYMYCYSDDRTENLLFNNCEFNNQYYYATYTYYTNNTSYTDNLVQTNSTTSPYAYGIYLYRNYTTDDGTSVVTGNRINMPYGRYGLRIYYSSGTANNRILVANNMVAMGHNTTSYYAYNDVYYSDYVTFAHNSINVLYNSSSTRAINMYNGSNNIIKNNVAKTANGYAFYRYGNGGEHDNNCLYSGGTNLGYFNGTRSDLSAWQTATGQATNSIEHNPVFNGDTDLYTNDATLNGGAAFVAAVPKDIDGNNRSTVAPDLGATEFTPSGLDAKIIWVGPVPPIAGGMQNVQVQIANLRTTTITSVELEYTDGTTTVSETFSGLSIAAEGGQLLTFSTQYNLQTQVDMSAEIIAVNGGADDFEDNNVTPDINVAPALAGVYTMGGTTADFETMDDFIDYLSNAGVSGPVTLNCNSGTYTGQWILPPFFGASETNTITIQSASGNRGDVTFQATGSLSSTTPHTIQVGDGAEWYVIRDVTILGTTSGSYAYTLQIMPGVANIVVDNCHIENILTSTSSSQRPVAFYPGGSRENVTINGCEIVGGYYGVYLYGLYQVYSSGIDITNNNIRDFYYYGVYYYYYHEDGQISGNRIYREERTSVSSTCYAVYTYYARGMEIDGNEFTDFGSSTGTLPSTVYGLRIYYSASEASNPTYVTNNLFYNIEVNSILYGVYTYYSDNTHINHNTYSLHPTNSPSSNHFMVYEYQSPGSMINNNLFDLNYNNSGQVSPVFIQSAGVGCEGNHFYLSGSNPNVFYGAAFGFGYPTLELWQVATGFDQMGTEGNPLLNMPNSYDLGIAWNSPAANNPGNVVMYPMTDINGMDRSVRFADRGAFASAPTVQFANNVDFGKVGQQVMLPVALQNTSGYGSVNVQNVDSDNGSFTLSNMNGTKSGDVISAYNLEANGERVGMVNFGIQGLSAGGQQDGMISAANTSPNNPATMDVAGFYASMTAFDEDGNDLTNPINKFDVGGVLVGGTPISTNFELGPDARDLDVPVAVTSYGLSGDDAALFRVSTIPNELDNTIVVAITLDPLGATPGSKTAFLTINHTAANGPTTVIEISGKVGKPLLGSPSLVDLPYAAIGQTYNGTTDNVAMIPLTRAGLVDVEMYNKPVLTGSGAGQMEIVNNNGRSFIRGRFTPGGEVVVDGDINNINTWKSASVLDPIVITDENPWLLAVRLREPGSNAVQGTYSAEIALSDGSGSGKSNAENIVVVSVVGQILSDPTQLQFYPIQLAFGTVPVGTTQMKTLTLRNQSGVAGPANLTITGDAFVFENGTRSHSVQMPADNSPVLVNVRFSPMDAGPVNGGLSASGVLNGTLPLSGTGLAANSEDLIFMVDGQVIENLLEFGEVAVGQVGTKNVQVVNNNIAPVNITFISRSGLNATQYSIGNMTNMTVAGNGGVESFPINFVPTSTTNPEKIATITVYNSTDAPKSFNVMGKAVLQTSNFVDVSFSPSSHNFGNSTNTYEFTLTNDGTAPATLTAAVVLGSGNFSVVDAQGTFPRTIAANGGTTTIKVEFDASQGTNGPRSATLLAAVNGVGTYPTATMTGVVPGAQDNSGSVSEIELDENVLTVLGAYPNPVAETSEFRYTLTDAVSAVSVTFYDAAGNEMMTVAGASAAGSHVVSLDATSLPNGTYFAVVSAGGVSKASKVVVLK